MEWFKNEFLPTFKIGKQNKISARQFHIFEKHLEYSKESGCDYIVYGKIGNLYIEAMKTSCMTTYKYFVTIKQLKDAEK
jgi:hypothetical protein